ncbi:Uncharacterised protein [Segatella copri]|nr:Uncharacterised protein [Segatella copri]
MRHQEFLAIWMNSQKYLKESIYRIRIISIDKIRTKILAEGTSLIKILILYHFLSFIKKNNAICEHCCFQ